MKTIIAEYKDDHFNCNQFQMFTKLKKLQTELIILRLKLTLNKAIMGVDSKSYQAQTEASLAKLSQTWQLKGFQWFDIAYFGYIG